MNISTTDVLAGHGLSALPSVTVDSYNLDVRDGDEILNHRLRRARFFELLDGRRALIADEAGDPLGDKPSSDINRKGVEQILLGGRPEAIKLIDETIAEFAQDMAHVLGRFLATRKWAGVQRVAVGGGFSKGLLGERTIRQAADILSAGGADVELVPIRQHADDAGLIGACHLLPSWVLKGHTAMIAADIGGTNLRVGIVRLALDRAADLSEAEVWLSDIWRHADDDPKRTQTVETLIEMIQRLIKAAKTEKLELVPVIGIGCPGVIDPEGAIVSGAVNLPGGNWESARFNLPQAIMKSIESIGDHRALVVMHNDAVMQGLAQRPWMEDVTRWGVITIGTGLGNACFTNQDR
jgi:hypothetical protein